LNAADGIRARETSNWAQDAERRSCMLTSPGYRAGGIKLPVHAALGLVEQTFRSAGWSEDQPHCPCPQSVLRWESKAPALTHGQSAAGYLPPTVRT